ncbi:MAG: YkgJ family cysteine cluster protein [Myxococcales bacterium]|nr:YkgJ family cysteine cluster protein [Myxococcales bacterium]
MTLRPKVVDGVRIHPRAERDGQAYVALELPLVPAPFEVPTSVAAILLVADGRTGVAELAALFAQWAPGFPGVDYLQSWLDGFERVGALRYLGYQLRTQGENRYRCQGCGFSCRGPEIPLIDAGEVARLEGAHAELARRDPALAAVEPFRRDPGGFVHLVRIGGECPFLDETDRCRLHSELGAEAKPLACRIFPLIAVAVGDEIRLGLSGSCFRLHRTFDGAERFDLVREWQAVSDRAAPANLSQPPIDAERAVPGREPTSDELTETRRDFERDELRFLSWLRKSAPTLGEVAFVAATNQLPQRRRPMLPADLLGDLRERNGRWARGIVAGQLWPLKVNDEGPYADALRDFTQRLATVSLGEASSTAAIAGVATAGEATAGAMGSRLSLADFDRRFASFAAYRLRNHVWLRRGIYLGSVSELFLLYLHALVAALDVCAGSYDDFGEALVLWDLALHHPGDVERFFAPRSRAEVRDDWRRSLSDAGWR